MLTGDKRPNLRETWTIVAAVGKMLIVFSMLPLVLSGGVIEIEPFKIARGVSLHLRADAAGMVFAVLASFLWVVTSFYSIGYMRKIARETSDRLICLFCGLPFATMGIAFAANLLTFFRFL